MIKKIDTDFGTYYFDSISFTLSSSPEYKNTSNTLDNLDDGILKKVVINISNSCNLFRTVMLMVETMAWTIE